MATLLFLKALLVVSSYVSWEDLQQLNEVDEEFTENF
jgi:hypothetical protein